MRLAPKILAAAVCLGTAVVAPRAAEAQSGTYAVVTGTVSSELGPLNGVLVTLTSVGGGSREATTNASGAYAFGLVAPGTYELRAEAIGFRPVVARPLVVEGGERSTVSLTLVAAPPPISTVDTLLLVGATSSRWRPGASRIGAAELGAAHRFDDLTSIVALASSSDAALGAQGLPGSLTLTIADGVPFYRAAHPRARSDQLGGALFPRSALALVTVHESATDVDLLGSGGGLVTLTTRSDDSGPLTLEGAWSGDALWSSDRLDFAGAGTPSLMSFQGSARSTLVISPGSSQLTVSGDVLRQETPLGPRIDEVVRTSLAGVDPALLERLAAPSVEQLSRYSGMARFDTRSGERRQIFVRGAFGLAKREFDGFGPLALSGDVALPEESTEFSFAAGWTEQVGPGTVFDLRAGVSGSDREIASAASEPPFALLVSSASHLGAVALGGAEASRVDVVLLPSVRVAAGPGTLRLGLSARVTSDELTEAASRETFFSDGAALVAGQGLVRETTETEASFTRREVGGFAQYDIDLRPGLSASLGARFDYEMLPGSEATLSTDWLQASGLRNDVYPSSLKQIGGGASLVWDPALDGTTRVSASASLQHGDVDPSALAQVISQDGAATSTYFAGAGLAWPSGALPGGATAETTLTLLGPDGRAPQTLRGSVGFVRQLGAGVNLHVDATARRTDFLLRRRNLNRPAVPQATDAYGRDVFGTLQQDGSLVTATGADVRRFSGFNDVWALDPDGWSKYWGVTAGLEYTTGSTTLYASYTRSKTTDNWVGGRDGLPDAQLSPALPDAGGGEEWDEGTSDFDVPDRVAAAASTAVGPLTVSAIYHFRSGRPFTPRYRAGVDANGDGSFRNDVAFVDAALLGALVDEHDCLSDAVGAFVERNSCRTAATHGVDLRLSVRVGRVMGRDARVFVDGLDLIEPKDGVIDDALLLVDPTGTITTGGSTVTVPVIANPDFGSVLQPASRGRMLRVGLRIG